ncbi:MAG: hypothetical protein N2689_12340 [Verrucomicrobiae bacterium]|nr:hypothetical protein [Verrucomicrobiae bacterium]
MSGLHILREGAVADPGFFQRTLAGRAEQISVGLYKRLFSPDSS